MKSLFLCLVLMISSSVLAHRGPSDRAISTSAPIFSSTPHPLQPTSRWGNLKTPLPTGPHWLNFALDDGNLPATPIPYVVRARADGLVVSFPNIVTSQPVVFGSPTDDMLLSATQVRSRRIVDYDPLSVTVQWTSAAATAATATNATARGLGDDDNWETHIPLCEPGSGTPPTAPPTTPPTAPPTTPPTAPPTAPPTTPPTSPPVSVDDDVITGIPAGAMTIPIVDGSAYITAKYGGITPVISSPNAIMTVNGSNQRRTYTGNKFKITTNTGKTYIAYVLNGDLSFNWQGNSLTATRTYNGVIRLAVVPNNAHESMLDQYKSTYPIAGKIDYDVSGDVANMRFSYITEGGSASNLLMLALPHHVDSLVNANYISSVPTYRVLKGRMTPIVGNVWNFRERLTTISWNSPKPIDADKVEAIKAAVRIDAANYVGIPADTYTFGKVASRYARLVLIADQVGETAARNQALNRLKEIMNPWMTRNHPNNLLYDRTWGGIISVNGRNDAGAEYGQGWYNDHHFHFGYFVYAAAVVAKYDSAWANTHRAAINDLVRDYANPSPNDPYFPIARHKDFFAGHSWASGLFGFGDAKNQESSSESVNGYYAVYLWGLAIGDNNIRDWGRLLMATEIRTTHKYWQMYPGDTSIYDRPFVDQASVGILWGTKVDYATWFGANVEYIHGIQFLPFTPITEELLPRNWIRVEYPILATSLTRRDPVIQEGWRGFVYLARSIIDKADGWNLVQRLNSYDNGNSRTNTLYFVATRP